MKITILSGCLLAFLLAFSSQTFAANFVVNNHFDNSNVRCDASCTLREAITAANNSPTDDTISFDPSVFIDRDAIITLNRELVVNNTEG